MHISKMYNVFGFFDFVESFSCVVRVCKWLETGWVLWRYIFYGKFSIVVVVFFFCEQNLFKKLYAKIKDDFLLIFHK